MSDSTVEKAVTAATLDQAVLVTAGPILGGPPALGGEAVSSFTRVAGLTVFMRAVLTLQRAGIKELMVVAGEEERRLQEAVRSDPRVTLAVRWLPRREFPPDDPRTWEALAAEMRGACLVASGSAVFSVELIERLREQAHHGQPVLVLDDTRGEARLESAGPVDVLAVPGALLRRSAEAVRGAAQPPLRALATQALAQGTAPTVRLRDGGAAWVEQVRDAESARAAERRILAGTENVLDGLVDTYVNRVLSRPLTRLFLALGVPPNAITVASMAIGLISALCFAAGGYAAGLVGALILQLAAVVDCCDGEVARATFAESEFGAQLDIVGDNVVHMAVFGGMAWGLYSTRALTEAWSWLPLALGAAAILGTAVAVLLVRRAKRFLEERALAEPALAARSRFVLKHLASRDFTVVVLVFAGLDLLGWFLALTAVGVNVFCLLLAWSLRPSSLSRA